MVVKKGQNCVHVVIERPLGGKAFKGARAAQKKEGRKKK